MCAACQRRHYRHRKDCPNLNEDDRRVRLLQKHGVDLVQFEQFLQALSRHYRKLARAVLD